MNDGFLEILEVVNVVTYIAVGVRRGWEERKMRGRSPGFFQ